MPVFGNIKYYLQKLYFQTSFDFPQIAIKLSTPKPSTSVEAKFILHGFEKCQKREN